MRDSVRRASALLAIAGLSIFGALHGCGGGGSGDSGGNTAPVTPVPTPVPTPTPAPSNDFLSVGLTSSDTSNNKTLLIVDADNPAPPRLAVSLSDALQNSPITSYHPTLDASTRTVTDRAAVMVYFANNGGVYQVSLRKTDKTVAQRISSLTTACAVTAAYSLNFNDGPEDDLLEVSESGPDGSCAQASDNRTVYVRTGAATNQQATALPFGVKLISELPSPTGATSFLAGDTSGSTPKLALYSADLVSLGDVANSTGVATVVPAAAVPGSGMNALYVRAGSGLRTLTWTANSASLSGSSYTYKSTTSTAGFSALSDSTALYIMDGLELRRKVSGSSAAVLLGTLDAANGTQTALLGMSTDHVLVMQGTSDGLHAAIYSLPKTGGAFVNLQALTNTVVNPLLGTYGDEVVYASTSGIWRANADGSNKLVITDHGSTTKFGMGKIVKPWGSAGDIDAIVWCEIPGSSSYCVNGTLKSQDLATGTTTTLGTFSHTDALGWYASNYGQNLSGLPTVLSATASTLSSSTRMQDMYIAQPGKSNSLVKISSQLH